MSEKRQPKSPWQRYGKKKWAYSTAYQLWREEAIKNGAMSNKAVALSCQHAKFVQIKRNDGACITVG